MYILNIANGRMFRRVNEFRLALKVCILTIMAFMVRFFPFVNFIFARTGSADRLNGIKQAKF